MILALAMGHTVERPAIRMGGGTKTYEEALPAAVYSALEKTAPREISAQIWQAFMPFFVLKI